MAKQTKVLKCIANSPVICPSLNREVKPGEVIEVPLEVVDKFNLLRGPYKEIEVKPEKKEEPEKPKGRKS